MISGATKCSVPLAYGQVGCLVCELEIDIYILQSEPEVNLLEQNL